ncbi:MAG: hypothetical protein WDN76_06090 [Alphaproteobacteria bacterium]
MFVVLAAGASGCAGDSVRQGQADAALYGDYLSGRYADLQRSDAEATTRYLSALRLAPRDQTLLKGAVESALAAGDVPRAEQAAEMARKQAVESELGRMTLAAIDLRDGKYTAASATLAHMPAGVLDRTAAQMLSAWALAGQGKVGDALAAISAGRSDTILTRMALSQSAILMDYAGQSDLALAAYERAEKSGFAAHRPYCCTARCSNASGERRTPKRFTIRRTLPAPTIQPCARRWRGSTRAASRRRPQTWRKARRWASLRWPARLSVRSMSIFTCPI